MANASAVRTSHLDVTRGDHLSEAGEVAATLTIAHEASAIADVLFDDVNFSNKTEYIFDFCSFRI